MTTLFVVRFTRTTVSGPFVKHSMNMSPPEITGRGVLYGFPMSQFGTLATAAAARVSATGLAVADGVADALAVADELAVTLADAPADELADELAHELALAVGFPHPDVRPDANTAAATSIAVHVVRLPCCAVADGGR